MKENDFDGGTRRNRFMFDRAWRAIVRWDAQLEQWFVRCGMTTFAANVAMWIVRSLLVVVVLQFSAAVLCAIAALLLVSMLVQSAVDAPDDQEEPEWRNGLAGFGLYDKDGVRIDPCDLDE